jgi:hypothetical protein
MAIAWMIARHVLAHPSRCHAVAPILQRRHSSARATGVAAHPSTNSSQGGVGRSGTSSNQPLPLTDPLK